MARRWWRSWQFLSLCAALLLVGVVHLAVDRLTREPPNYTLIEEGLYLGGSVPEPPPGTRAVLNLCETKDRYEAEVHAWEPIRDAEPAPDLDWLRRRVTFVAEQRHAGRTIYVHCHSGFSRGARSTQT